MRPLGEALSRAGIAAHGVRLPGHGTTPAAMLDARAPDWLLACDEALARLPGAGWRWPGSRWARCSGWCSRRGIPSRVARGGGARTRGALPRSHAELAPALRAAAPLLELVRPWVLKDTTDLLDAEARADAPVLRAWPSARLRDLWEVQDLAWGSAARVTCPVLVMVAAEDHVVDPAGAAALVRRLERAPSVRHVRIEDSAHILPRDRNRDLVAAEVTAFVDRTFGPAAVR